MAGRIKVEIVATDAEEHDHLKRLFLESGETADILGVGHVLLKGTVVKIVRTGHRYEGRLGVVLETRGPDGDGEYLLNIIGEDGELENAYVKADGAVLYQAGGKNMSSDISSGVRSAGRMVDLEEPSA